MFKKIILISIILVFVKTTYGQQDALLNFGSFADMYNNPAHIINNDVWSASLNYKNSLPGVQDGPLSYYLDFGGPLGNQTNEPSINLNNNNNSSKQKYGLGAYILKDSYGYFGYNSFMINYAQKFMLTNNKSLSFGIGTGIFNYAIDRNKLRVSVDEDEAFNKYLNYDGNYNLGDVNFGIIYHSSKIEIAVSSRHILKNVFKIGDTPEFAELNMSYNASFKYRYEINRDLEIIPNIKANYIESVPLDLKLSIPFVYQEFLMAGLSYTYKKNTSLDVGIFYEKVLFAYSFSLNTSKLSLISNTSHNIGVRYILPIWSSASNFYSINKDLF